MQSDSLTNTLQVSEYSSSYRTVVLTPHRQEAERLRLLLSEDLSSLPPLPQLEVVDRHCRQAGLVAAPANGAQCTDCHQTTNGSGIVFGCPQYEEYQ